MAIVAIDLTEAQDVLSSGRARGVYDGQLKEFVGSGEVAGRVDLEEGIFKGKKPQTIKSGFETAKEKWLKLADAPPEVKNVEIRNTNGNVYLVRTDLM